MKKILIETAALIMLAAAAPAAAAELERVVTPDLVTAPPAYGTKHPTGEPVVTPDIVTSPPAYSKFPRKYYNWTGAYAGISAGIDFGHWDWSYFVTGSSTATSGLVGPTVGYNLQTATPIVLGVEADLSWTGMSRTLTAGDCSPGCKMENPWIATARVRGGYAFNTIFPYLTAGAAMGDLVVKTPFRRNYNNNLGWTAGIGVESVVIGPWRVKAEYLHVYLAGLTCTFTDLSGNVVPCLPNGPNHFNFSTDIFRVGFNYRIWD
jgi:outer membrane immunogenic protein